MSTSSTPVLIYNSYNNGLIQSSVDLPQKSFNTRLPAPLCFLTLNELLDAMWTVLDGTQSASLTAPQIGLGPKIPKTTLPTGIPYRIFVLDTNRCGFSSGEKLDIINPVITAISEDLSQSQIDACLSLPDTSAGALSGSVARASTITLSFLDRSAALQTRTFTGVAAFTVQHALDHLNGKLCYSNWSPEVFEQNQNALALLYAGNYITPNNYTCTPSSVATTSTDNT